MAIDHKMYTLQPGMCVIADSSHPVALGGVMGGESSEVSSATTELLIEAADFAPLAVRAAARDLRLHSSSSYRFERGVDPEGIDWASRRACELISEMTGGELLSEVIDVQPTEPMVRPPVVLRFSQIPRVLGIDLEKPRVVQAATARKHGGANSCRGTGIRWRSLRARNDDPVWRPAGRPRIQPRRQGPIADAVVRSPSATMPRPLGRAAQT